MMEAMGLGGVIIFLIFVLYPYLALGRIWLYSKKQVELLEEIRSSLGIVQNSVSQ